MKTHGAYERFVRPILFSLDPETAHHLAIGLLKTGGAFPALLGPLRTFRPPDSPTTLFGLHFRNPIGLAAGFDKNAVALPAWEALGFGFVEIGTVTAKPQPGNPKPRIFRYPEAQALINRLGFNNDGADVVAERLRTLRSRGGWPAIPVGINIGKSKVTPVEQAAEDYRYSFRKLSEFADYIVLNVSSPNTPGLRALQEIKALTELLSVIREENRAVRKPVLLKIAPDLSLEDLDDIVGACEQHEIAGLIATNTTLDHSSIAPARDQTGGLSGPPVRGNSTAFVSAIKARTSLPIIGMGGISDAESAREKFDAGASLIQVYTGYIYRGPGLLAEIAESQRR
ncbi:MAG: quinone-dependent dihydroorotate dehydrogenase [Verrucomicrobiota bacterium]|nr:quinone-dependent dihydroorotate dehydrogenase [Verrucomicrobiota bacterium]